MEPTSDETLTDNIDIRKKMAKRSIAYIP